MSCPTRLWSRWSIVLGFKVVAAILLLTNLRVNGATINFPSLHLNYGETEKILEEKTTEALARLAGAIAGYGTNRLRLSLAGALALGDLTITNLTVLGNLITI